MHHPGHTRRFLLAVAALGAGLAYLTWRIGWTLDASPWLAVPLVVAEVVAFARFALGLTATLPEPASLPDPAQGTSAAPDSSVAPGVAPTGPTVEVLIPTTGAGPDDLARTMTVAGVVMPSELLYIIPSGICTAVVIPDSQAIAVGRSERRVTKLASKLTLWGETCSSL